jgi:hypothetical protein
MRAMAVRRLSVIHAMVAGMLGGEAETLAPSCGALRLAGVRRTGEAADRSYGVAGCTESLPLRRESETWPANRRSMAAPLQSA